MKCTRVVCHTEATCVIGIIVIHKDRPVTRLIMNLPLCDLHLQEVTIGELMTNELKSGLGSLLRLKDPRYTIARVELDDPDYLILLNQRKK